MDKPWKSLGTEELQQTPFPLVRERLLGHTGAELVYTYVPGRHEWVSVLPVTSEGRAVMVRQYRHVWGDYFLEFPAGGASPGESPEAAVRRELREETGAEAGELIALPSHRFIGSFVASRGNPFLALEVRRAHPPRPDDGEVLEVMEIPLKELYERLEHDPDLDAAATILLLRARPLLAERGLLG